MPVFPKRLLCTRSFGRRRPGCQGGSSSEDDDDLQAPADAVDNTNSRPPKSRNNTEYETGLGGEQSAGENDDSNDSQEDDFRFFLTVADLQPMPTTVSEEPTLEFDDRQQAEPSSTQSEALEPRPSKKPAKKRPVAKSSCGRASSNEDESSMEDVELKEPPEATPQPPDEDFLVLLTGLLAHGPPPLDDFRFLLTVHQAEAAT